MPDLDPTRLAAGWQAQWQRFAASAQGRALLAFLDARVAAGARIFPPRPLRALELTPPEAARVVVLGQDPYHGEGQAHGLAFSVPDGVPLPPSLRNIFRECSRDLGVPQTASGSLERWAAQGVLLLNTVLTVEEGRPGSHAGRGWEAFTASVVATVAARPGPRVFLLWGAQAQAHGAAIRAAAGDDPQACVLQANHPSPLAARRPPVPFVGCGHFSAANRHLVAHGSEPIRWSP